MVFGGEFFLRRNLPQFSASYLGKLGAKLKWNIENSSNFRPSMSAALSRRSFSEGGSVSDGESV
jgi:hypothetical protein